MPTSARTEGPARVQLGRALNFVMLIAVFACLGGLPRLVAVRGAQPQELARVFGPNVRKCGSGSYAARARPISSAAARRVTSSTSMP